MLAFTPRALLPGLLPAAQLASQHIPETADSEMRLIARTAAARSASVAHRNARLPPSSSQGFYYLNNCPSFKIPPNSRGWERI